jgi:hypothetical protein
MERRFFDDVCSGDLVIMKKPRFVQEHKKLLQVLKDMNPKKLEEERKEQEKELKDYLKKSKKASSKRCKE